MPPRNLWTIALAAITSLACYLKATHSRYASTVAAAMELVRSEYLEPVDDRVLFENALKGMVEKLDPYSTFIPPDDYRRWNQELEQAFGGIGVVVKIDSRTNRPMVASPIFDSPAFRAGIRAGDVLMEVDGLDTKDVQYSDLVRRIQGPPGTEVRLKIQPYGHAEVIEYKLTRALVSSESVLGDVRLPNGTWEYRLPAYPQLGYVRIGMFGRKTTQELQRVLSELVPSIQGLIIDLRGNSGGLLSAAIQVCDLFLTEGEIVRELGRNHLTTRVSIAKAGNESVPSDLPVVVLVDQFSASASEVMAACLQDHKRAKIVGQRTWGKGTVQRLIELEGGRCAVSLTTETYHRPSGRNIHRDEEAGADDEWGVVPDPGYLVELSPEEYRMVWRIRAERDAVQLPKSESDSASERSSTEATEHSDETSAGTSANGTADRYGASSHDRQLQRAIDHLLEVLRPQDAHLAEAVGQGE